jgi:HMG (high mobility group) box
MFRSEFWAREKQKEQPIERNHPRISRIVSHCWNSLSKEEKAQYEDLAEQRRRLHRLQYPNYKYSPGTRTSKSGKKPKKEWNKRVQEENDMCRKLASLVMDGLSSSNTQKALKDTKKEPRNGFSKTCQRHLDCHAINSEAPTSTQLVRGVQIEKPVDSLFNEGFMPTDEIPQLDPSAAKDKQVCIVQFSARS